MRIVLCAGAILAVVLTGYAIGTTKTIPAELSRPESVRVGCVRVQLNVRVDTNGSLAQVPEFVTGALSTIKDVEIVDSMADCVLHISVERNDGFEPPAVALSFFSAVLSGEKSTVPDPLMGHGLEMNSYLLPQHFVSIGSDDSLEQGCRLLVRAFEQKTLEHCRAIKLGSVGQMQRILDEPASQKLIDSGSVAPGEESETHD